MDIKLSIASQEALISSLKNGRRPIAILTGSPLSLPDAPNSPGVPGVSGIIDIIKTYLSFHFPETVADFSSTIESLEGGECYQKAIEFVRNWINQDAVNEIIQQAVFRARYDSKNLDPQKSEQDTAGWYLPKGVQFLSKIYAKNLVAGPILTTNFDPLLAIALKNEKNPPIQTVLSCDGSLNQNQSFDPNQCNIVYLHGYWHGSDTLHTPDQLIASRPRLKSSLKDLLNNKTLLVIAYGGWDDVFLQALNEIVEENRTNFDILWAFHEKEEEKIKLKYKKLISFVSPAISRGRFRMYGGIECNDFFERLYNNFKPIELDPPHVNNAVAVPSFKENIENQIIPLDSFSEWRPVICQAHKYVREVEQAQFIEEIKAQRIVSLIADWGMGKADFIKTSCEADSFFAQTKLFRVNVGTSESQEDIEDTICEQLRQPLQNFIIAASKCKENVIFVFDDFNHACDKPSDIYIEGLKNIFSIIKDFSENIFIVIIGRSPIKYLPYPSIALNVLDDADQKNYISNHPNGGKNFIDSRNLTILSQLSGGIPMQLDRLLSDLTVVSMTELLDQESSASHIASYIEDANEPVPISLLRSVEMLSSSEDEDNKRCFMLLTILSVLKFGESLTGIKRFDNSKPIFSKHIKILKELGLLETITPNSVPSISEEEYKVHQVPPQVREYVISLLKPEEIKSIVLRATELTFGERWCHKEFKLSIVAKHRLRDHSCSRVGNPHLLATYLLRLSIENKNKDEIRKAFDIVYYYCRQLYEYDRYKDSTSAAEEIISLVKESSVDLPMFGLYSTYGRSLRMIGEHELAIQNLETAVHEYETENKNELASANLSLAMAYLAQDNKNDAINAAKKVQELTPPNKSKYIQASDVLIDSEEEAGSTNYLKRKHDLKKIAQKNNATVVANNIMLDIARYSKNCNIKTSCYDSVIKQNEDQYNQMRAAVNKGEILIQDPYKIANIRNDYLILLNKSYSYFFTQRFNSLFNQCHKILWIIFESNDNRDGLLNLFKYSSLIWRLRGEKATEKEYAEKLNKRNTLRIKGEGEKTILIKYITYRIKCIFKS